jgi:ankyrin repeat protein
VLRQGASPNARNNRGETPLHVAARHYSTQYFPIIANLLEGGANAFLVDATTGKTPQELATNPLIQKLLEEHTLVRLYPGFVNVSSGCNVSSGWFSRL